MKFTLSWLKDHLDTNATIDELSEALTRVGLEVESVEDRGALYRPFTVAHITATEPHPNADRLQICTVDNGEDTQKVVCGAPNARAGIKVVLARVGTTIPDNGMVLRPAKIRGVESNGMLCSARELGLGDNHDGIMELPEDTPIGNPFAEPLGLDDVIFDIAITPDRGDCLGVRGIARDLAAAGIGTLKPLMLPSIDTTGPCPVSIAIEDTDACKQFVGRLIANVKNDPAPDWMRQRLEAIGLRPISTLVDITNYVSVDLGRPLHVYDADKLGGALNVRPSKAGESFKALNDKTYTLEAGECVIADAKDQIGLGGIVGGEDNSVSESTTNVLLEVAWFDPVRIATTGRRYQVDTDARYRFERTVDPDFLLNGSDIATQLILDLCGGAASERLVVGEQPKWQREITFRPARVAALGGIDLPTGTMHSILDALGFGISENGENWTVTPPSWRNDVEGEADIVEEVLRIHGYDNIPATPLPKPAATPEAALSPAAQRVGQARQTLASRGMREIYSFAFIPQALAERFGGGDASLRLQNPISTDLETMRPNLVPGLLMAAARNHARGYTDLALFEAETAFGGIDPKAQAPVATALRTGQTSAKNHYTSERPVDTFDAKADALAVLVACGAPVSNLQISADAPAWYHPGRSGSLKLGKNVLAYFGEVHPRILREMDVTGPAVICEVFMDRLPLPRAKSSRSRPAYLVSDLQPIERDFAFIVEDSTPAEEVLRTVRGAEKQLITDVRLFDVYMGKGIPDGKKSLALMVTMQPTEKTLTDQEIEAICTKIIQSVEKNTGAVLRGSEKEKAA